MSLRIEERDGAKVVNLVDPKYIDEAVIHRVGQQMMAAVQDDAKIIFDFSGVRFISSAMIGKFVLFNKAMHRAHGKWAMYSVCEGIMEPFRITLLNRVFIILKDEKEALAYVNGKLHCPW